MQYTSILSYPEDRCKIFTPEENLLCPEDALCADAPAEQESNVRLESAGGPAAVLRAANAIPNGGGYNLKAGNFGLPIDVYFGNEVLYPRSSDGSYCSGFTFAVVMRAAAERNLLVGITKQDIKAFLKTWYGNTSNRNWEKQCVAALLQLGIGQEIADWHNAIPGDFMQLYYNDDPNSENAAAGHSVVFLGFEKNEEGEIIGVGFRSSQGGTSGHEGVGNAIAYLLGATVTNADKRFRRRISRVRLYVGRLN